MTFDPNDPKIPLIGQKPVQLDPRNMKPIERDIDDFLMGDKAGTAKFHPLTDLTTVELARIQQLFLTFLLRTPVPVTWRWRPFLKQHGLERHFIFTTAASLSQQAGKA